jgi:predicted membrane-bound spermidine synthase
VLVVGTLVGLEIPLVMRILKRNVALKDLVSQVLTFDYLGALAVSLAFPPGAGAATGLDSHRAAVWPDERGRCLVGTVAVSP